MSGIFTFNIYLFLIRSFLDKVSGFNSFYVRNCDPISRGVLSLSLSFNELTFTTNEHERGLDQGGWRRRSDYGDHYDHGDYGQRWGGGQMVQVYDLGLEYGFASESRPHSRVGLSATGVTLNTQGALYRYRELVILSDL